MTIKETLLAFACGVAAIATTHTLMVDLNVRAQGDEAVDVCVNSEGVMRLATDSCPAGQQRVRLKEPKVERTCEKEQQANIAGLGKRIADLEARAEGDPNNTAVAPFEVVNERDIVVFSVDEPVAGDLPAMTRIFDETGARIAMIAARASGGEVSVSSARSSDDDSKGAPSGVDATLSAYSEYADFTVTANSNRRLELGRRRQYKNYALSTFGAGGMLAAGLGSSEAGSGIALIADALGRTRIRIRCEPADGTGGGMVEVINAENLSVATLSGAGDARSGFLQLTNNAGEPMVNGEVFPKGVGAVRAGPGAFQHGLMFIPLPASYIEGKKP